MKKKLLALLLSLVLVIGLLPMTALADGYTLKWVSESNDVNAQFTFYLAYPEDEDDLSSLTNLTFTKDQAIQIPENYIAFYAILNSYDQDNYEFVGWMINNYLYNATNNLSSASFIDYETIRSFASVCGASGVYIPYTGRSPAIFKNKIAVVTIGAKVLDDIEIKPIFLKKDSIAFTPTVEVAASQTERGTIGTPRCIGGDTSSNRWTLATEPAAGYELSRLVYETGNDAEAVTVYSEDGKTVTWDVTSNGVWTAYFDEVRFRLSNINFGLSILNQNSGVSGSVNGAVSAGQRAGVFFMVSIPTAIPESVTEIHYALYAGETASGTPLASYTATSFNRTGKQPALLTVDSMPAGVTALTISAQIGDGTPTTKTIPVTVNASGSTDLVYMAVPGAGPIYGNSAGGSGSEVYDAATYTDPATGVMTLYLGTSGGVAFSSGGAFTTLGDLTGEIIALGTDADGNLTAVKCEQEAVGGQNDVYQVYNYTDGAWTSSDSEGHKIGVDSVNNSLRVGLVMGADDVWLQNAHWNGSSWESHSYGFNSFFKADATTAYAGSSNGLYVYSGGNWTLLTGVTGTQHITAGRLTAGGATLTVTDNYYIQGRVTTQNNVSNNVWQVSVSGTDAAATELDIGSLPDPVEGGSKYVGIGADGSLYAITRGRFYENQTNTGYQGSYLYKYVNGAWKYQIVDAFNDPELEDDDPSTKYRPDCIRYIVNPVPNVTLFLGGDGEAYALYSASSTITFDPGEGAFSDAFQATKTAEILSPIGALPTPTLTDYALEGWYYDEACTKPFTATVMPAKDVTLHAKWVQSAELLAQLAALKEKALGDLETQYKKYSSTNYSAENWAALQAAYEAGKTAINAAEAGAAKIGENVDAALNDALNAMQAVPVTQSTSSNMITVAVSMDANTLGLGYLIEPTLVSVKKGTPVSVVITDLLSANAKEKYDIDEAGLIEYHADVEYRGTLYPWVSSGAVKSAFYLQDVYFPEQTGYKIPEVILAAMPDYNLEVNDADKDGRYLSEFDYTGMAGWMYSVGDKTYGGAQFPGTGANGWMLSDGEVVRWQFSLVGYGSDLNANNTQWGSQSIIPTLGDKSALTWKVAEINTYGNKASYGEDYAAAVAVLTDAEATQKQVDDALAALKTHDGGAAGGSSNKDKKTETEAEGTVTAEELQAAADKGEGVKVVTENGTVKLDAGTVKELAKDGKEVSVAVTDNGDGTKTVSVTADGKAVDADVKTELEAKDGQMLVIVGADGSETPVILSVSENGVLYAEVPAGATVKVVDAKGMEFGDVKADDWFAGAVEFVTSRGIFQGTGEGFEPGLTMNRAMLATVLFRLSGEAAPAGGAEFGDVPADAWFADAVAWASAAGIVNGRGEGFAPDAPVTREEIATMLYRFVQYLGVDVSGSADLGTFPDGGETSPWAKEAMAWAVSVGLFKGDDAGSLNPAGKATRAEVATLVERLVKLLVK